MAAGDRSEIAHLAAELVESGDFARIRVVDAAGTELAEAGTLDVRDRDQPERHQVLTKDGNPIATLSIEVPDDWLDNFEAGAESMLAILALLSIALSAVISYLVGTHLTRQFKALGQAARRVARGEFAIEVTERGPSEFRSVARAMNVMSMRIGQLYANLTDTLADRTRTLDSTFAHMSAGVAIFDDSGCLVAANNAFSALLGLPPSVVVPGVSLDTLVDVHLGQGPQPIGAEAEACVALCRNTGWPGPSLAFELPFPDGRVIAVQRTRLPDGGFIATHEDVTQRCEDQRRLLHSAKLATLGELATATAHELNQPLNVIRLCADNARARLAAGKADEAYLAAKLERISAQTERAANIIDHMRVFGRKPVEAAAPFDLSAAVGHATEFFTETARLRGYELELAIEPGVSVIGHAALIEQVVANLLSNAMAACAARRTQEAPSRIRVTVCRKDSRAHVEVADNAGGIPAEVLPRIFEPFFTTKPGAEGTGLGLSISYGIVSDMGGRLIADNDESGAVFSFDLPMVSRIDIDAR
ncbi:MAG TPA: PAS-domain containing protein [Stellaceae bacterium]|nr:PAS-domain containing protein [Stellaceae bacterium]